MAAPQYTTVDAQARVAQAAIKQAILKSSDWAHLQLSTGTQNTTLTAGASAGATSVQVNTTIPSGSLIVIGNGAANPECRITTGVSGTSGAFVVTFADPLVNSYSNGAAVGVGFFVKATTTRGAQMVVDLNDAAWDNRTMTLGIYRTHDGTTGVDKITRYIRCRNNSTTATTVLHLDVSCSKEMLFFGVEGARAGETGLDDATYGSSKQCLVLADIVPYHAGDTVPAVACVGHISNNVGDVSTYMNVSRNQGNNASWVQARLMSLQPILAPQYSIATTGYVTQAAKGDGNYYVWPFVVVEGVDGLRGRLNEIFFSGFAVFGGAPSLAGEGSPTLGAVITYSGNSYKLVAATKGLPGAWTTSNPLGLVNNSISGGVMYNPLIAVPIG